MTGTSDIQSNIRVAIAEDHPKIRATIQRVLENVPDISVVCAAENGYEAIECVNECSPEILLLDIEMPGLNGIEVIQALTEEGELPVRIIVISTYMSKYYSEAVVKKGAAEVVPKHELLERLIDTIHRVAEVE